EPVATGLHHALLVRGPKSETFYVRFGCRDLRTLFVPQIKTADNMDDLPSFGEFGPNFRFKGGEIRQGGDLGMNAQVHECFYDRSAFQMSRMNHWSVFSGSYQQPGHSGKHSRLRRRAHTPVKLGERLQQVMPHITIAATLIR